MTVARTSPREQSGNCLRASPIVWNDFPEVAVKLTFLVPGEAMRMKRNSHPTACMKLVMTQRGNGEQSTSEKANTVPTAIAKIVPNTLSFYFGLKIRALIQSDSIHLKEGLTRTLWLLPAPPAPACRGTAQPPWHRGESGANTAVPRNYFYLDNLRHFAVKCRVNPDYWTPHPWQ